MLAFMPCPDLSLVEHYHNLLREDSPAFGECVWHASPAMKIRSFTENFDATRCPTVTLSIDHRARLKECAY